MNMKDFQSVYKSAGPFFYRMDKNLFRRAFFIDNPLIHIKDFVGDFLCKTHLMSDDHHGFNRLGELPDDGLDFSNHGRIQCGSRFIKENGFRIHGQCSGNGDTLLLTA